MFDTVTSFASIDNVARIYDETMPSKHVQIKPIVYFIGCPS